MATQQQIDSFITNIAPIVKNHAAKRGYKVCSPIIAQACLESNYGTSELAKNAYNYFGIKYREGRCPTCIGIYEKVGSEQNNDGSYNSSNMKWCKFANMEGSVVGYFDFISISRYSNLIGVSDAKKYLELIKQDGYCTSLKYVDNVMSVITKHNLTQYDGGEKMANSKNSSLVVHTNISPNKTSPRSHAIDTITIHCTAGQMSAEVLGKHFAKSTTKASSNYGVDKDGRIGMYVEEGDRSWCSSNAANDNRAITIEVSSDATAPYGVSDKVLSSLITLLVDICKRNNIKELKWKGDKSLVGQVDKQNMTVHRWFKAKACPGEYLYEKHSYIADEVNKQLGSVSTSTTAKTTTKNKVPYTVKVKVASLLIRDKASITGSVTGVILDKGVYTIVEESNGFGKLKSGKGWIYLEYTEKK